MKAKFTPGDLVRFPGWIVYNIRTKSAYGIVINSDDPIIAASWSAANINALGPSGIWAMWYQVDDDCFNVYWTDPKDLKFFL